MRPLYLSVKGFGPYLKVEINEDIFNLIHRERLFLITGEVGAGKTTLFDAILFSLFGEASFPERSAKDLISHLLKKNPQILPEVIFKFFFGGKTYKIVRRPAFGRHNASVSLWINDILYSQKSQEVSQKIKELLGLEAKQFKKVFLIPQGEYREVILSEPKERKELFEKLFDTALLGRLEDFFKNKVKLLKEKISFLKEKEKEILALAEVSSYEELTEKILYYTSEISKGESKLSSISAKLKSLEEELKKLEKAYELLSDYLKLKEEKIQLENKSNEIDSLKEKVFKLKALMENLYHYETIRKLWVQLRQKAKQRKDLFSASIKLKEELSNTQEEWEKLREREPDLEKKKEILLQKKRALEAIQRYQELLKELREMEDKLRKIEEERNNLEKEIEKREFFRDYLEKLRKLTELKKKEKDLRLFKEKKEEYQKLLKEKEELERKRDELKEEIENLERKAIAVKLAETLKEGEPCPVCGSKVHPHKASADLFLFSLDPKKKELEKLEIFLEKKKSLISQREGEISILKERLPEDENLFYIQLRELEETLKALENISLTFKNFESSEINEKELNKELEELNLKKKELEREYIELQAKKGAIEEKLKTLEESHFYGEQPEEDKLKREFQELEKFFQEYDNEKRALEEKLKNLQKELVENQTKLQGLQSELEEKVSEYRNSLRILKDLIKRGIFKNFQELKDYYQDLSNLENYEEKIHSFEENFKRNERALEELKKDLEGLGVFLKIEDLDKLKELLEALNKQKMDLFEKRQDLSEKRDQILGEIKRIEEVLKNLEKHKKRYEEILEEKRSLEEEYPYLEKIFNLLSGNTTKISFHSYALSKYLSLILKRASFYLSDFTLGRYRFVEGEVFTKQFILEVFDNYTGTKREVKTLSGGESFLASLSFALSSADILISLSKRGPFETLLIDEGFGSLDEKTLERVIQGLLQVSQKTGKIVGIISHLRELKERFPVVIEVIKDREKGSRLKIWRNF
ncbi:MAG: AAA family ATPase [Caldimicrobium sp.]